MKTLEELLEEYFSKLDQDSNISQYDEDELMTHLFGEDEPSIEEEKQTVDLVQKYIDEKNEKARKAEIDKKAQEDKKEQEMRVKQSLYQANNNNLPLQYSEGMELPYQHGENGTINNAQLKEGVNAVKQYANNSADWVKSFAVDTMNKATYENTSPYIRNTLEYGLGAAGGVGGSLLFAPSVVGSIAGGVAGSNAGSIIGNNIANWLDDSFLDDDKKVKYATNALETSQNMLNDMAIDTVLTGLPTVVKPFEPFIDIVSNKAGGLLQDMFKSFSDTSSNVFEANQYKINVPSIYEQNELLNSAIGLTNKPIYSSLDKYIDNKKIDVDTKLSEASNINHMPTKSDNRNDYDEKFLENIINSNDNIAKTLESPPIIDPSNINYYTRSDLNKLVDADNAIKQLQNSTEALEYFRDIANESANSWKQAVNIALDRYDTYTDSDLFKVMERPPMTSLINNNFFQDKANISNDIVMYSRKPGIISDSHTDMVINDKQYLGHIYDSANIISDPMLVTKYATNNNINGTTPHPNSFINWGGEVIGNSNQMQIVPIEVRNLFNMIYGSLITDKSSNHNILSSTYKKDVTDGFTNKFDVNYVDRDRFTQVYNNTTDARLKKALDNFALQINNSDKIMTEKDLFDEIMRLYNALK